MALPNNPGASLPCVEEHWRVSPRIPCLLQASMQDGRVIILLGPLSPLPSPLVLLVPPRKALMNVPSTDFKALVYIVPPSLHRCEPVNSLKRGADSLETAKFVDFWQVRCLQPTNVRWKNVYG